MKTQIITVFAAISLSVPFVYADNANVLVDALGAEYTVERHLLVSMGPYIEQLPKEKSQFIRKAVSQFAQSIASDPEFKKGLIGIYKNNFSEEEIDAIFEFYKTPAGQKILKNFPKISEETVNLGFELSPKYEREFNDALKSILTSSPESVK